MWWRYILFRPPFALLGKTKKYGLRVTGTENVPRYGPFIVVANHQSSADIVAIALALRPALVHDQMWPWAKIEIESGKEGPLGKYLWKIFGVIPIDREAGKADEAIRQSLEYLRRGDIVCIFPEGTRHKTKELGSFKFGVANLARATPAPILPVGVWRRDEDGGVSVRVGQLFFMPPKKRRYEALEAIEERLEERITPQIDGLRQWGSELPRDKRGMKMVANMINVVTDFISQQGEGLERLYRMAEAGDNDFIRNKVYELLPPDWVKAGTPPESRTRQLLDSVKDTVDTMRDSVKDRLTSSGNLEGGTDETGSPDGES